MPSITVDIPDETLELIESVCNTNNWTVQHLFDNLLYKYTSYLNLYRHRDIVVTYSNIKFQPKLSYNPDEIIELLLDDARKIEVRSNTGERFILTLDAGVDSIE